LGNIDLLVIEVISLAKKELKTGPEGGDEIKQTTRLISLGKKVFQKEKC